MPENKKGFEEIMNQFMKVKMKAMNASYSAIFDFNEGTKNYADCQRIVYDSFQKVTAEILREFNKERFS